MAKHLRLSPPARPLTRTGPGYELELAPALFRKQPPSNLLLRLSAIQGRGGAALGDAYAFLAGHVLVGVEWLEDLTAERRLRRNSAPRAPRGTANLTPRIEKILPSAE